MLSWAQGFFVAGLVLGLLFIIPAAWFPLPLGKVALIALCMLVSAFLVLMSGTMRDVFQEKWALLSITLIGLLPVGYLASYYFSVDRTIGLTGFAVETDTVVFVILCFFAFLLSLHLFRTTWSARVMLAAVSASAAIA